MLDYRHVLQWVKFVLMVKRYMLATVQHRYFSACCLAQIKRNKQEWEWPRVFIFCEQAEFFSCLIKYFWSEAKIGAWSDHRLVHSQRFTLVTLKGTMFQGFFCFLWNLFQSDLVPFLIDKQMFLERQEEGTICHVRSPRFGKPSG